MSQIRIQYPHSMSHEALKTEIDALADELRQTYGAQCRWVDDRSAQVQAPGVKGKIRFDDREILIEVKLGMMMAMLKGTIESDIRSSLNKRVS